jgi:hypothetical protein
VTGHISDFSDVEFREECARRGIHLQGAPESALRERVAACDRAIDEWRARAEAAELRLRSTVLIDSCDGSTMVVGGVTYRPTGYESGHGIARRDPRPDNSVAHLDEDLLCEDA